MPGVVVLVVPEVVPVVVPEVVPVVVPVEVPGVEDVWSCSVPEEPVSWAVSLMGSVYVFPVEGSTMVISFISPELSSDESSELPEEVSLELSEEGSVVLPCEEEASDSASESVPSVVPVSGFGSACEAPEPGGATGFQSRS